MHHHWSIEGLSGSDIAETYAGGKKSGDSAGTTGIRKGHVEYMNGNNSPFWTVRKLQPTLNRISELQVGFAQGF